MSSKINRKFVEIFNCLFLTKDSLTISSLPIETRSRLSNKALSLSKIKNIFLDKSSLTITKRFLILKTVITIVILFNTSTVEAQGRSRTSIAKKKQQGQIGGLVQNARIVDEDDQNPLHQLALRLNISPPQIPVDFDSHKIKIDNPEEILNRKGLRLFQNVWKTNIEEKLSDEIDPMRIQIMIIEGEVIEINSKYNVSMNQLAQVIERTNTLRSYAQKYQYDKSSLRSRINSYLNQIQSWQSRLRNSSSLSRSSIDDLVKNIDDTRIEINRAESSIIAIDTELLNISTQIQQATSIANELQSNISYLQSEYRIRESAYNNISSSLKIIIDNINKSYLPLYADDECINALYQYNKDLPQWTSIGPIYFAVDNIKFLALNVLKPIPIEPQRSGSKSFQFKTDNLITRQISNLEHRKKNLGLNNNELASFDEEVAKVRKDWNERLVAYEVVNQDPFVRGALREMTRIKREKYEITPSRGFMKLIEHIDRLQ